MSLKFSNKCIAVCILLITFISFISAAQTDCTSNICRPKPEDRDEGKRLITKSKFRVFTVTDDADSFKFKVRIGKKFAVKIYGNPSTGYAWYLDNAEDINRKVLKPLNLNQYDSTNDFVSNPHPAGMVGVGGNYFFRFIGKKAKKVTLRFVYRRSPNDVARTVEVKVKLYGDYDY